MSKLSNTVTASASVSVSDLRDFYKEATANDTSLSEESLQSLIEDQPNASNLDADGWVSEMKALEQLEAEDATRETTGDEDLPTVEQETERLVVESSGVISKLANDAAFIASVTDAINAQETVSRAPVTVCVHLERIWDDGDWAMVPEPGSVKNDPALGNRPWDIEDGKQGNRKVKISWYKTAVNTLFPDVAKDLADIQYALRDAKDRDGGNQRGEEWARLPILKRMGMEKTFARRVGLRRTLIEKAVKVRMYRDRIRDTFDDRIGVDFDWAGDGKSRTLNSSTNPILLWDNTVKVLIDKVCEPMSVVSFLKFTPDRLSKVKANETDTYKPGFNDLISSMRRDREAAKSQKEALRFAIEKVADLEHSFISQAQYVDQRENFEKWRKMLNSYGNKPDPANPKLMTERQQHVWMLGQYFETMDATIKAAIWKEYQDLVRMNNDGNIFHPAEIEADVRANMAEAQAKAKVA